MLITCRAITLSHSRVFAHEKIKVYNMCKLRAHNVNISLVVTHMLVEVEYVHTYKSSLGNTREQHTSSHP